MFPLKSVETAPVDVPMVATEVVPLVQLPPPASVKVVDDPKQRLNVPEIADGNGLTVTGAVM